MNEIQRPQPDTVYTGYAPQPQPQGAPQGPYPAPGGPIYIERRTNGLAIAAFVLGLLGFAILPVILGHIALKQIRARGDAGSAFAIIGLVLGYLALAVYIILFIVILGGTIWAVNA